MCKLVYRSEKDLNQVEGVQGHYYKLYWEPLEKYFPESRKLEEFFRYYLAVKTYKLYPHKDVYEGFKRYWSHREEKTETKLREIHWYLRYSHEIYDGGAENKDVERSLKDFRKSDYSALRILQPRKIRGMRGMRGMPNRYRN